jgi:hypothetical protein
MRGEGDESGVAVIEEDSAGLEMVLVVTAEEDAIKVGDDSVVAGEEAATTEITGEVSAVVDEDVVGAGKTRESSAASGCGAERTEWTVGRSVDTVGDVVGVLGLVMGFGIA